MPLEKFHLIFTFVMDSFCAFPRLRRRKAQFERLHALCPPTCSFLAIAVAPSSKFMPLRMAFLP